jgi:S-adenosylmethionine synthetase
MDGCQHAKEAHVLLVSRIGMPIEEPQVVHVRLRAETPGQVAELAPRAQEITRLHIEGIGLLWELLLSRNIATD